MSAESSFVLSSSTVDERKLIFLGCAVGCGGTERYLPHNRVGSCTIRYEMNSHNRDSGQAGYGAHGCTSRPERYIVFGSLKAHRPFLLLPGAELRRLFMGLAAFNTTKLSDNASIRGIFFARTRSHISLMHDVFA